MTLGEVLAPGSAIVKEQHVTVSNVEAPRQMMTNCGWGG